MSVKQNFFALLASMIVLSACGGGGGGDTGASNTNSPSTGGTASSSGGSTAEGTPGADQSWLTFSPSAITVDAVQGQSTAFTVSAHASKAIAQAFNIGIVEDSGLITTEVSVNGGATPFDYNAVLHVSPLLATGTRSGTLVVKLCEDDPVTCSKPVSGSPWRIPLTVNVIASTPAPTTPTGSTTPTTPVTSPTPVAPTAPAALTLQFNKSAFAASFTQGESSTVSLTATTSRAIEGEAKVGVFERTGLLSSGGGNLQSTGQQTYSISLPLNASLAVGQYSSTLEVRVCQDDPSICNKPLSGSPWNLPLSVNVTPTINLTALTALPGVPAWSTQQGNAGHTGAIVASVDPSTFTRRFNVPTSGQYASTIAADGNAIYAVRGSGLSTWTLQAISENSGAELWHVDLGTLSHVNPPAAANGKVYLTSTGHADSYLWIFDQATGALLAKQAMSSQWENYMAPTIYNGSVYSDYGYYGGMAKYDAVTGAQQWTVGLSQYDGWTPAVDSQYAYTYVGGVFTAVNSATGVIEYTVNDPRFGGWNPSSSVVLGNGMLYATDGGRLTAMNLTTRAISWYLQGNGATGQPALSANTLYLLHANGTVLEARDPASGAQQWLASLGSAYNQVVVTSNLAFVSNSSTTLAVDLSTHQIVWSYPLGGTLAISQRGVLYIVAPQKIAAVNLK